MFWTLKVFLLLTREKLMRRVSRATKFWIFGDFGGQIFEDTLDAMKLFVCMFWILIQEIRFCGCKLSSSMKTLFKAYALSIQSLHLAEVIHYFFWYEHTMTLNILSNIHFDFEHAKHDGNKANPCNAKIVICKRPLCLILRIPTWQILGVVPICLAMKGS